MNAIGLIGRAAASAAVFLAASGCSAGQVATVKVSGEMRAVGGPRLVAGRDRPMVGSVSLVNTASHRRYTTSTGSDGRYSVNVPRGNYRAYGTAAGYASAAKDACSAAGTVVVSRAIAVDVICVEV